MDYMSTHYWEMDADGMLVAWHGYEDATQLIKYRAAPPSAKEMAFKVYDFFAKQDMDAIDACYEPQADLLRYGDTGTEYYSSFREFAQGVLGRLPTEWPTFKIEPQNGQILVDTPNKFVIRFPAKTENGMDTHFTHLWGTNDAGKVSTWHGYDDSKAWEKTRL